MASLSAIIITKNEEDNIERSITSVQFADEVIVVDAESNDSTVAKAKQLGANVFVRPWPGYGPQKNFGGAQARGDWLLFIDADEEVPPALQQEIRHTIEQPGVDFYWVKIITIFLNRPLRHLYGHNPRLLRKAAGSWTSYYVHEQIQTNDGRQIALGDTLSGILRQPLHHYSHQTIGAYLKRMTEYTALDAQHMAKHDRHRSGRPVRAVWYLPYYLALRQFIKLYGYKRGVLDGYVGLLWSALSAYYEYVMGKKYLRLKSGQRLPHQPVLR
jgi:glycosyltransferase involved in cell wall biosynthesis